MEHGAGLRIEGSLINISVCVPTQTLIGDQKQRPRREVDILFEVVGTHSAAELHQCFGLCPGIDLLRYSRR